MDEKQMIEMFKALGDDTRIRLIRLLCEGEMCASELLEEVAVVQSTLSHHMKVLTECGLVTAECEGKRTYYKIDPEAASRLEGQTADLFRGAAHARSRAQRKKESSWNQMVSFID